MSQASKTTPKQKNRCPGHNMLKGISQISQSVSLEKINQQIDEQYRHTKETTQESKLTSFLGNSKSYQQVQGKSLGRSFGKSMSKPSLHGSGVKPPIGHVKAIMRLQRYSDTNGNTNGSIQSIDIHRRAQSTINVRVQENKNEFEHRGTRTVLGRSKDSLAMQQSFSVKDNFYLEKNPLNKTTSMVGSFEMSKPKSQANLSYLRKRQSAGVQSRTKVSENLHQMRNWLKRTDQQPEVKNDFRLPSYKAKDELGRKCFLNSTVNFKNMQSSGNAWTIDQEYNNTTGGNITVKLGRNPTT